MKVTYYLEVLSSWCYWAEPAWAELKARYAARGVEFDWKIALMKPEDFPASAKQYDWFLRRSGGTVMHSPFMLNSAWLDCPVTAETYPAASAVAEAARSLGAAGDEVRLALAHAAEREGRKMGRIAEAVKVAAKVAKLDPKKLRAHAESPEIKVRIAATTAEFFAHQIDQRPAFVITDDIGDKAVFSGLVRIEPLAATIDAMLADQAAYAAHKVHFGAPPAS
jgi:predicted DsbA family dithiol-disulfide isomerase